MISREEFEAAIAQRIAGPERVPLWYAVLSLTRGWLLMLWFLWQDKRNARKR